MIDLEAYDMRTLINFEIERIYAGWFDVLFKSNKEEVVVTASDAWGNAPTKGYGIFIENMLEHN